MSKSNTKWIGISMHSWKGKMEFEFRCIVKKEKWNLVTQIYFLLNVFEIPYLIIVISVEWSVEFNFKCKNWFIWSSRYFLSWNINSQVAKRMHPFQTHTGALVPWQSISSARLTIGWKTLHSNEKCQLTKVWRSFSFSNKKKSKMNYSLSNATNRTAKYSRKASTILKRVWVYKWNSKLEADFVFVSFVYRIWS